MRPCTESCLIFDECYPLRVGSSLALPTLLSISGGGAAPTQFDVWLSDGAWAYVRYRSGILTVDFGTTDWIACANAKCFIEYEPKFEGENSPQECSWSDAEPFLLHALAISAGRRFSSEGYVILEPAKF